MTHTMAGADSAAGRYTGSRVPRVEDPRLLRGRGTFVDDVVRPRMLHACFVRSPFARARLGAIDATGALALPGVRAVYTAADLNPGVHEAWYTSMGKDVPDTPRPPLAEGVPAQVQAPQDGGAVNGGDATAHAVADQAQRLQPRQVRRGEQRGEAVRAGRVEIEVQ